MEAILDFLRQTGFYLIGSDPKVLIMMVIACVLMYLAIKKQFEPLLLLPIAFGMLLTNLPGAGMYHADFFLGGHVDWTQFAQGNAGLIDILYLGVKLGIYPCLIFIGVGAMTDFGPLIANPKCGRSDRDLCSFPFGSCVVGPDCGGGLFLYGLGAGNPAADYARFDHPKRARDRYEAASAGL